MILGDYMIISYEDFPRENMANYRIRFCNEDKYILFLIDDKPHVFSDWKDGDMEHHTSLPEDFVWPSDLDERRAANNPSVTITFEGHKTYAIRKNGTPLLEFGPGYDNPYTNIISPALSNDGNFLGIADYWEDGDQREYPEFQIYSLEQLFRSKNWERRKSFLIFTAQLHHYITRTIHTIDGSTDEPVSMDEAEARQFYLTNFGVVLVDVLCHNQDLVRHIAMYL